jgi:hypothetical protein
MKFRALFLMFLASGVLLLSGCGGDNNGSLTVSKQETDATTYSTVSFTITYTNPTITNVIDVPIEVTTSSPIAAGYNSRFTIHTNNSGSFTLTYLFPRDPTNDQFFNISTKTGELVASTFVVIPKQGTITTTPLPIVAIPSSITFTSTAVNGDTQSILLSGGNGSLVVQNINPSPNPNISATVAGNTLTVTKTSSVTGGVATILVLDTATPPDTVTVTVNY